MKSNSSKDETIIIGAHLDSINRQNWTVNVATGRAPGANDDGSGIALLLEIFRVLASEHFLPNRSIEFHFYSAEEEGLYGSADIAANYARAGKRVAAMLQLDQCGYLRDPKNETIAVYTDNTDPQLTMLMEEIVNTYATVPAIISNENHRADSDFHSWTNNGFRAAYIAEGPIDDIVFGNDKHTPHDEIRTVSLPHVMHVGRAAVGYLVETSLVSSGSD